MIACVLINAAVFTDSESRQLWSAKLNLPHLEHP